MVFGLLKTVMPIRTVWPVWPDLAKICDLVKLSVFFHLLRVYLQLGNIIDEINFAIGQVSIVVNGQILNK